MNWTTLMCSERIRPYPGRRPSGNDYRTEFEKDYQRIISSASFRRLQDKTQVFPLDKSDFIRTRLTHSLEVANFARSLGHMLGARIINEGIDSEFTRQTQDDICAVLECAGLLHDIGNPPFGHFGEDAIRDYFKRNMGKITVEESVFRPETDAAAGIDAAAGTDATTGTDATAGTAAATETDKTASDTASLIALADLLTPQQLADFYNFEGNTQALRVVTKLHFMVDENGMNLTKALLATIMKYPGSSLEIKYDKKDPERDVARKKMGYFYADRDIFADVEKSCGTNGKRHPLSFLLEAADDIAYKTADIEDAIKKGLLDVNVLIHELEASLDAVSLMEFISKENKEATVETTKNLIDKLKYYYNKALSSEYENPALYAVQNWVVRVQGVMLTGVVDSFIRNYTDIMSGNYKKELIADTSGELVMDILGSVAYRYAFISEPILKLEVAADAIFDFLLGSLVHALLYYDTKLWGEKSSSVDRKIIGLISSTFMQNYHFRSDGLGERDKLYLRLLLATDYVSGMTDSYAKRLYRELRGID